LCIYFADLRQKDLETLIPKVKGAYVCIVSGKYKGKVGFQLFFIKVIQ